jgi:endoglucanase
MVAMTAAANVHGAGSDGGSRTAWPYSAVAAIRQADPDRLVISEGLQWGREPVMELADLGVAQSTRGYDPFTLTHYMAPWVQGEKFPVPGWPVQQKGETQDREMLDLLRRA